MHECIKQDGNMIRQGKI